MNMYLYFAAMYGLISFFSGCMFLSLNNLMTANKGFMLLVVCIVTSVVFYCDMQGMSLSMVMNNLLGK